MVGHIGKTTNSARTKAELAARRDREDQWGPIRGEVISYDAATQTATIRPKVVKKDGEGNDLMPPDLEEVPVDFGAAGGGGLTMPVKPGDLVMLTATARSSEADSDGRATDTRSRALSDMRATVVGGNEPGDGLKNVDAENTHLRADAEGNYGVKLSPDGKMSLAGSQGELMDLLNQVLTALKTEPALINTGVYSDVDGKVGGMKL